MEEKDKKGKRGRPAGSKTQKPETLLNKSKTKITEAFIIKLKSGKASAEDYKLAFKILGVMKEEQNINVKVLTGADIADIDRQVRKHYEQSGKGSGLVRLQGRPSLLHQPLRDVAGQSGVSDQTVQAVGLPEGVDSDVITEPQGDNIKSPSVGVELDSNGDSPVVQPVL